MGSAKNNWFWGPEAEIQIAESGRSSTMIYTHSFLPCFFTSFVFIFSGQTKVYHDSRLEDLHIKGLNVQNTLFRTDIQDYLKYKHWISLLFIWLPSHGETDFQKCHMYYYSFVCLCINAISAMYTHFLYKLFKWAS